MRAKYGEAQEYIKKIATEVVPTCILWPFGTNKHGYGRVKFGDNIVSASTAVCVLAYGPKPDDKDCAAHRCGVRLCVNPLHLYWATHSENNGRDKDEHGTSNHGLRNGRASTKLTEEEVREIRSSNKPSRAVAKDYGVCHATVLSIKNKKNWKWLK